MAGPDVPNKGPVLRVRYVEAEEQKTEERKSAPHDRCLSMPPGHPNSRYGKEHTAIAGECLSLFVARCEWHSLVLQG
jgi:hypothetical protein